MLPNKSNKKLTEISKFFTENFDNAASSVFNIINKLGINDKNLGLSTRYNNKHFQYVKFIVILIMQFCCIKNVASYRNSTLYKYVNCGKDTLYRFKKDNNINFRKINYFIINKLRKLIEQNCEQQSSLPKCLIIDDTDLEKTGYHSELIGKIFSHVKHAHILGYKMLAMLYNDGKSIFGVDFSLHGEPGKRQDYGLTKKQRNSQFKKKNRINTKRIEEYTTSKIKVAIQMLKRAFKYRLKVDYILADSWFCCLELIKYATKHLKTHYLGMAKLNKTLYEYKSKLLTISQLIKNRRDTKYSQNFKCHYICRDVKFKDIPLRMYCIRLTKKGKWRAIITTNTSLDFERAMRIYAMRWSIEVFFKECKQYLGLNKCQSVDFDVHIAEITFSFIRYNILSTVLRVEKYETIGGLFEQLTKDTLELTINERILLIISEILNNIIQYLYNVNCNLPNTNSFDNQLIKFLTSKLND